MQCVKRNSECVPLEILGNFLAKRIEGMNRRIAKKERVLTRKVG
jgi:hypothetical protein